MKYVLDTNIVSRLLSGDERVLAHLADVDPSPCEFIGCTRDSECVQTGPDPFEPPAFTCVIKAPPGGEGGAV